MASLAATASRVAKAMLKPHQLSLAKRCIVLTPDKDALSAQTQPHVSTKGVKVESPLVKQKSGNFIDFPCTEVVGDKTFVCDNLDMKRFEEAHALYYDAYTKGKLNLIVSMIREHPFDI